MAHSYSHLFGIPCTGLRFFTVYGPWGRPDMSPIQFARAIVEDRVLQLFNHGEHQRDFTYIDDIVESIARLIDRAPQVTPCWITNNRTRPPAVRPGGSTTSAGSTRWRCAAMSHCWKHLGQTARIELLPLQAGDVLNTCADASDLARATGFKPRIELDEGLGRFIQWFLDYYARPAHAPLATERLRPNLSGGIHDPT
ncbi:NAD-dependent epimerase/dehydratase family protein [Pseudomonas brassicacearum]